MRRHFHPFLPNYDRNAANVELQISTTAMKRTIVFLGSILWHVARSRLRRSQRRHQGKPGEKIPIAVPDFRGAGDAQSLMNTFNGTLCRRVWRTPAS